MTSIDERQLFIKDYLGWKMTLDRRFDGRWPLIEDNLWWKTTFNGRLPLMKDTFDWWGPQIIENLWEDVLQRMTTFHKNDFQWEMNFDGEQPLIKDYHHPNKNSNRSPHQNVSTCNIMKDRALSYWNRIRHWILIVFTYFHKEKICHKSPWIYPQ